MVPVPYPVLCTLLAASREWKADPMIPHYRREDAQKCWERNRVPLVGEYRAKKRFKKGFSKSLKEKEQENRGWGSGSTRIERANYRSPVACPAVLSTTVSSNEERA